MRLTKLSRRLAVAILLSLSFGCSAWEWTDVLGTGDISFQSDTLSMEQVREMRVRDIKRRLARTHGYSADELGRMIDKKELIEALSFEEHKDRQKETDALTRALTIRGIFTAIAVLVVILGWPLWAQVYAVGSVNFVVYTDRKMHEAKRCLELRSYKGMVGVLLMSVIDILQFWLSASVLLSWFTTSKYFFPIPSLPIRPAQFMGDKVAQGPMGKYGMNVGPMAVTWVMRFVYGRIESATGRVLSRAYQVQKKAAREWESPEDRAARKAARKAVKKAAKEEAAQKKREEDQKEAERRKEAAKQATDELFPSYMPAQKLGTEDAANPEEVLESEDQMPGFDMNELD